MKGWPLYRTISLDPMITNLESISWRRPSHCQYENMKPGLKGMFTFELVILSVYDHRVEFPLYLAGPEMDSILLCVICSDIAVLLFHLIDCAKLFVTEWHFVFIFTQEYPPPPSPHSILLFTNTNNVSLSLSPSDRRNRPLTVYRRDGFNNFQSFTTIFIADQITVIRMPERIVYLRKKSFI